jgi:hypothetical protein
MTGFISRMLTRHSSPQNIILPRLPGKYESTTGTTQNLFENDLGTSDINATHNSEEIGNNGFIPQDKEALPDKSKTSTIKPSHATFQTSFLAEPTAEISKNEGTVFPNDNNPGSQSIIPKFSIADTEQNSDGVVNYKLSNNHKSNEKNAVDNKAIISSTSKLFASAVSEKVEELKEKSFFQIQQPLFTALPKLPNGVTPITSTEGNQQPVIKVHIGRIEIKAINQPPSNDTQTKKSNVNKPAMSLDDYLKKRNAR